MNTVENEVRLVVSQLVDNNELFTALDVSNKVKETIPHARHREVRDEVKKLWATKIEPNSYARTPIDVNLANGDVVQALLYHPLSDSWDLETKYDAQKRNQSSQKAVPSVMANAVGTLPAGSSLSIQGTPTPNTVSPLSINPWGDLFGTQPSLFPRR